MSLARPLAVATLCGVLWAPGLVARERLDSETHTCIGAHRTGTEAGVAPFTGRLPAADPAFASAKGFHPGPYVDDEPLFVITAANAAEHADYLTEGQKALFAARPDHFRMPVYPSRRDIAVPQRVCDRIKADWGKSEVAADGLNLNGPLTPIPFPFPKNGLEALWNTQRFPGVWNETATLDTAAVFPSGSITWGRMRYQTLAPAANPALSEPPAGDVAAYFITETLLPLRDKGAIHVGYQPLTFTRGSTHVWAFNPGTRRMRQAPDIAFDHPVPPSGLRTVDDDHGFNGSPERYTWTLVGQREIYIPYNNYRLNDPSIKYADLLTPYTLNPDHMRYELHRVWVIEGQLRDGMRHVYGRRVLYADEDTWMIPWADNYDTRGALWRSTAVNIRYAPEAAAFHRGVTVHHDLISGAYEAGYLVNESAEGGWQLNRDDLRPQMFSPQAAARRGH